MGEIDADRADASRLLIIGLGSAQGSDRLGWDVVSLLHSSSPWPSHQAQRITLHRCVQPARELPGLLRDYPCVILVDAVTAASTPGTIYRLSVEEMGAIQTRVSSHGLGIVETLRLAAALGELPARLRFVGLVVDPARIHPPQARELQGLVRAIAEEAEVMFRHGPDRPAAVAIDP